MGLRGEGIEVVTSLMAKMIRKIALWGNPWMLPFSFRIEET